MLISAFLPELERRKKMTTAKNIILNQFKDIQNKTINQDYENKIWQIAQENHIEDIYQLIDYFENSIDDVQLFKYFYQHYEIKLFARPSVTIDLIYLRYHKNLGKIQVLLKKRQHEPFKEQLSLYGSFLEENQSINNAVLHQCKRDLGFNIDESRIIRLPAVSKPGRDPRMWVITNPNIVLLSPNETKDVSGLWVTLDNGFKVKERLAFDHQMILEETFDFLKADLDHKRLPYVIKLLGKEVTLPDLRNLLSVFDVKFKKQATANILGLYKGLLVSTGEKTKAGVGTKGGRPSLIYTYLS